MQKTKNKVVNNRPLVFTACFLFLGIFLSAVFRDDSFILLILLVGTLGVSIALFCFKKKYLGILVAIALVGMLLFSFAYERTRVSEYQGAAFVEGKVVKSMQGRGTYQHTYILDNALLEGEETHRKILLYSNAHLEWGDIVLVEGYLESFNYQPFDSYSMSHLKNKVNYILKEDNINIIGYKEPNAFNRLYLKIRQNYIENMGDEAGGVALSLVFGDTSTLDKGISNDIRDSGIYHIFSVSGLHVAFMAGMMLFVCKQLRLSRTLSILSVSAITFLYGIMTGFPASMIRAMVMLRIFFIAQALYKRYDPLSGLAAAGIVIVVANPLSLFELGFQMSLTAMLGIICFYHPIKRFLSKRGGKVPNYLSSSIAMSLSAMSIMLAILLNTFNTFGVYFCLGNLIIIPLVTLTYTLLMFFTLINLILPFSGFLFQITKYLLLAIIEISRLISSLPFATVQIGKLGIFAFIYAITIIFMSKFIMTDKKYKYRTLVGVVGFSLLIYFVI